MVMLPYDKHLVVPERFFTDVNEFQRYYRDCVRKYPNCDVYFKIYPPLSRERLNRWLSSGKL